MGTEYNNKYVETNMEDSGNSCGSSVVSDQIDLYDADGVQVSDLEGDVDSTDSLPLMQVILISLLFLAFVALQFRDFLL